jgi:hypothetical protein
MAVVVRRRGSVCLGLTRGGIGVSGRLRLPSYGRFRLAGRMGCGRLAGLSAPGLAAGRPSQEAGGAPAGDPLALADCACASGCRAVWAAARLRLGTVEGRSDGGRRTGLGHLGDWLMGPDENRTHIIS